MLPSIFALLAFTTSALALIAGADSSTLVSTALYQKAKGDGFVKVIPRGYQEACGSGGRVDPNFVQSYNNALAAGITNIDTYWFPCNGSGNNCKSYETQLAELVDTINANSMQIGTIWVDIEKESAICNNVSLRLQFNS